MVASKVYKKKRKRKSFNYDKTLPQFKQSKLKIIKVFLSVTYLPFRDISATKVYLEYI